MADRDVRLKSYNESQIQIHQVPNCCPHCPKGWSVGVPESPAHWLECGAFRDLREGSDPKLVFKDWCKFLRKVIKKKKKLEEKIRTEQ